MKDDFTRIMKFIIMDYSLWIRDTLNVIYFANYITEKLNMGKYFIVTHVIFLSAVTAWKTIAPFVIKIYVHINR